jgi:hypothetical protein
MAAHAVRTAPTPLLPTPTQHSVRRTTRRSLTVIAVVTALVLTIGNHGALAAASHAVCTWGTPAGTTCGEALYLIGFPV